MEFLQRSMDAMDPSSWEVPPLCPSLGLQGGLGDGETGPTPPALAFPLDDLLCQRKKDFVGLQLGLSCWQSLTCRAPRAFS